MKFRTAVLSCLAAVAAAGSASAAPRQYNGSDTLENFTKRLVFYCGQSANTPVGDYPALAGATPDFDYLGGGSGTGGNAMKAGTQDIAPQSRAMNQGEFCATSVPAGPQGEAALTLGTAGSAPSTRPGQNLAVARDGISVVTSRQSASRCDTTDLPPNDDGDFVEGSPDDFGASLVYSDTSQAAATYTIPLSLGGTYTFSGWRDVLRVLWAGADSTRFPANANTQTAANRLDRCNSDIRRSLVANWDNIVKNLASGANDCGNVPGSCQNATTGIGLPLRHVLRRDDSSGTTDTFVTLLNLNAVGGTLAAGNLGVNEPFCNGKDTDDKDPIRIRCTTNSVNPTAIADSDTGASENPTKLNDETCDWDQTTGLVLALRVPNIVGTSNTLTAKGNGREPTQADLYPVENCPIGVFDVRRPPKRFNDLQSCPDGAPYLFTGCLTPLDPNPLVDCNCVNAWTNRSPFAQDVNPTIAGLQNDGRAWNRYYRGPNKPGATASNQCPVLRDERGVEVELADARLRYRSSAANATPVPGGRICREQDATRQIGCISRAAECTIGYAGREAIIDEPNDDASGTPIAKDTGTTYNGATALLVGPGDTLVAGSPAQGPDRNAIFATIKDGAGYQLGRKLYFNSIVGFSAVLNPTSPNPPVTGFPGIAATGTRLPTTAPENVASSFESSQLVECLLLENPDDSNSPLRKALGESGFLQVSAATAKPFIDNTPAPDGTLPASCP